MIKIKHKGNFSKTVKFLESVKETTNVKKVLDRFGREGVSALAGATPVDSGLTANSWYYEVQVEQGKYTISFHNSNIQNGVPIAIILQYGHGTRNGGWVDGMDYINPAIQPIFDKITDEAWKEITKL